MGLSCLVYIVMKIISSGELNVDGLCMPGWIRIRISPIIPHKTPLQPLKQYSKGNCHNTGFVLYTLNYNGLAFAL